MDINAITLECLMNPQHYDTYTQKLANTKTGGEQKEQLKFYKKRILSLTKDMFKNKFPNRESEVLFGQLTDCLIAHFEFLDKKDIMQEEYDNYQENAPREMNKDAANHANNLLINTPVSHPKTLDDFVIVTNKKTEREIIPTKKIINIKEHKFKRKGLKPKV
jgi:hypothetical protein